jgi:hypothetical protein
LGRDLHDGVGAGDRGVVHQDIHLTEVADDLAHRGRAAGLVAHIAGIAPMLPPDLRGCRLGIGRGQVDDRDPGAVLGEQLRRRLADAARRGRAGDDRGLALQQHRLGSL